MCAPGFGPAATDLYPNYASGERAGSPTNPRARARNRSLPKPNHFMAQLKINPVGDRILIQHIEEKEQIKGGVIIPDSAKEKPQEAKVIALGSGRKDKDGVITPFEVKVGDKVLVAKY